MIRRHNTMHRYSSVCVCVRVCVCLFDTWLFIGCWLQIKDSMDLFKKDTFASGNGQTGTIDDSYSCVLVFWCCFYNNPCCLPLFRVFMRVSCSGLVPALFVILFLLCINAYTCTLLARLVDITGCVSFFDIAGR